MTNLFPGTPIFIPDDAKRRRFEGAISEIITDYERQTAPLFDALRIWWRSYEAIPRSATKDFPFKNAPLACDTEVLGLSGWHRVDELCVGDMVLTRRDGDGGLEWKPVLATPVVWADELIHFKSNSLDQMVTPEHTMVTYTQSGVLKRRAAKDIFQKTGIRIPLTGSGLLAPCPEELFGLPAGDAMEFLGWYLSEGWHNTSNYSNGTVSKGTIFIGQSRSSNPQNCQRLENLFNRLGFGWNYMKSNQGYSLYARDIPLEFRKHIYEQGHAPEKFIPGFVYNLGPDLLWRLMEGLVFGDGCLGKDGTYPGRVSFYSTSKRLADGFQTLAALVGCRATISTRKAGLGGSIEGRRIHGKQKGYSVNLLTRDRAKLERCEQRYVPYHYYAYCVTVQNHAIYVRRGGIPSWTGNSNVVVPLAQMMVDALVARTWTTIFAAGHRVWQARTENENNKQLARDMVRYINWQADGNDFDFRIPSYDWVLETVAMGSSVLAGNWREQQRHLFVRQGRGKSRTVVAQPVRFARGPLIEHIPREQILWDTNYLIQEAPCVIRELSYAWDRIAYMASNDKLNGWDLEAIKTIRGQGGPGGPSEEVRDEKRRQDYRANTMRRAESDHDIREVHIDWPLLNEIGMDLGDLATPGNHKIDTPLIPIVVTHHRKIRRNLRAHAEPYFVPYKPFFDVFYRKRSGRGHSVGVVKKLEGLQSGLTTIYNQGIDAQTRANSFWGKTNIRSLVDTPIDPSRPLYVPGDMSAYEPLDIPGADFININLMQITQAMAERLTGQADPAFGRETRLGGHPSPATTTIALMQNADLLSGPMKDLMRTQLSRVGEFIAVLDQQFEADEDGKIRRVLGDIDAESVSSFLIPTEPIPGNYQFNVRGLSQDLNPDAKLNRAVMVSQMNNNYWGAVLRATEVLMRNLQIPNVPQEFQAIQLKAYTNYIRSSTESHIDFLEAADVDDIEKYILTLERNEARNAQSLRDFAGRAGELATAGQGGPNGRVAPTGGVPRLGAPEAFGGFGEPTLQ